MRCLILLMLCACGGKAPSTARIVEATDADLADCAFLQKVKGTSQSKAKQEAASVGATHIKWIVPCCTYVEADAYRCDVPE